jgi:hypothetical protein
VNGQDVKDLNVIIERLEQHETRTKEMRDDIKFIKENLFNPHEGLWSESRLNTQFRENTTRWRFPIGVGFISLAIKHVWDLFNGT